MKKLLKFFAFACFLLCISYGGKAIEEIVNPLLPWSHVQTVFSKGDSQKVHYIYKKNRRSPEKKNSFLVCSYPRIYGMALESRNPSSNCLNKGEKYTLSELEEFLFDMSILDETCPALELVYSKVAPEKVIEHILSKVTFVPSINIYHCDLVNKVEPIIGDDGSLSLLERSGPLIFSGSGNHISVGFKGDDNLSYDLEFEDDVYVQKQTLPCFPDEVVQTKFSFENGVYEELDYGSEIQVQFKENKKSLYGRLLKLGKSIPGFKGMSRKEISNKLVELDIVKELRPTRKELKEMVDQVVTASTASEASENMYVFGATLILQRMIKQTGISVGAEGEEKEILCDTLNSDCHQIIGKSIYGFKSCLSLNISKKTGADNCIKQFMSKAMGQISFDVSEALLESYISKENAELLCIDKKSSCDENFCSKKNCVEQAMVVLKNKAKKQIRSCFKSFDPKNKKGESDLESRLYACVISGVVSSIDYLTTEGGPKKIISAAKKYLEKYKLNSEAKKLIEEYFLENSLRSCFNNSDSISKEEENKDFNYDALAGLTQDQVSESLFSCVDSTSFNITHDLMGLVLPYEVSSSISSLVENKESRNKIVEDVVTSVLEEGGEFQRCADEEMSKSRADRDDDNEESNYQANPENCLTPLTMGAYFATVNEVIADKLSEVSTSDSRINESLGEEFVIKVDGKTGGIWMKSLIECQEEKKDEVLSSNYSDEDLEKIIEQVTVECAILGIGGAAKIITVDELINHPKIKEYKVTLGNRYERKIADAVKSCVVEEFEEKGVKTIEELGRVYPEAKTKCQDLAIHKTLHPEVTKSIVEKLLEGNLKSTNYKSLIPALSKKINSLYECNYYRLSITSTRYQECIRLLKEYDLSVEKLFVKGIPHDKTLEFLEGDFTKSAYKIVITEILEKKAFNSVSEKLEGDLNEIEKRDVLEALKKGSVADFGVDLLLDGKEVNEIEGSLESQATKHLAPVVLKHTLLRKDYDQSVAGKAQNNLESCLQPIDPEDLEKNRLEGKLLCNALDICISREILLVAKSEANKSVDSIINGLGNDEKWGHRILKKYSKIKAKAFVDACIEKEITCKDYTTFPNYSLEMQQYTIFSCILD